MDRLESVIHISLLLISFVAAPQTVGHIKLYVYGGERGLLPAPLNITIIDMFITVKIVYIPKGQGEEGDSPQIFENLLRDPDLQVFILDPLDFPGSSDLKQCDAMHQCLYLMDSYVTAKSLKGCLQSRIQSGETLGNTLECPFQVVNRTDAATWLPAWSGYPYYGSVDCTSDVWELTPTNWNLYFTDRNLITFIEGGFDTIGLLWPGLHGEQRFSEALGLQLLGYGTFFCTLETPCSVPLYCSDIGARSSIGASKEIVRTPWGYFALASLEHINQQISGLYQALQGASFRSSLTVWRIDDFYPVASKDIGLLDLLTGFGTIFAVSGGFAPAYIAPGLSSIGAILPMIGTYFDRHVAQTTPLKPQKEFVPYLEAVYALFLSALQEIGAVLFKGGSIEGIEGSFNITDMMKEGAWVDPRTVEPLPDLEERLRVEILSRSINNFWMKPSNATDNKMWLAFNYLNDDAAHSLCLSDATGPQAMKYCADGGVYYTYNFIEDGHDLGHLGYPWGAEKLPELNIPMNVRPSLLSPLYSTRSQR